MLPTFEQIQDAAYYLWENRGRIHGFDRENWLTAEQALLFVLNYEVIAHYILDGVGSHTIGNRDRRVCRFCERSIPARVPPSPAVPESFGNRSLSTFEECEECREQLQGSLEDDLGPFLEQFRGGRSNGTERLALSLGAMKGFVKLALSIMPGNELASFEEAIEWVCNPDPDFDARLFQGIGCYVHPAPSWPSHPWIALARRIDDDVLMPSMLLFFGTPGAAFEVPVPVGTRDEDLDGEVVLVPRIASPLAPLEAPASAGCTFFPAAPADQPYRGALSA